MSLLNKIEKSNAEISNLAEGIAGHLQCAIAKANSVTSVALVMSNDELTEWLNAKPWEQRQQEFAGHGILGDALNAAAEIAERNLGMTDGGLGRVNVQSVPEKLQLQWRELTVDTETGKLVVRDMAPPPTPEPDPNAPVEPGPLSEPEPTPEP